PRSQRAHEQRPAQAFACPAAAAVALAVIGLVAVLIAFGLGSAGTGLRIAADVGTLTEARLWWVNPFTAIWRKTISLRVRNFQSERIKVNDASGNPIEIAAVVVWRVTDTAKTGFDVDGYERFVTVQSETSLRHLAGEYPYDDYRTDRTSLRGNADEVRNALQAELQERLE